MARRIGIVQVSLAVLGIIACGIVYGLAEHVLGRRYDVPSMAVAIPTDPADISEGQRLALVHGCFGDCHGSQGQGRVMFGARNGTHFMRS